METVKTFVKNFVGTLSGTLGGLELLGLKIAGSDGTTKFIFDKTSGRIWKSQNFWKERDLMLDKDFDSPQAIEMEKWIVLFYLHNPFYVNVCNIIKLSYND